MRPAGCRSENPTPTLHIVEAKRDSRKRGSKIGSSKKPSARKTTLDDTAGEPLDADLQAVVTAWYTLPDAIRRGIVAMVKASTVLGNG